MVQTNLEKEKVSVVYIYVYNNTYILKLKAYFLQVFLSKPKSLV